jgi:hypothetical protein
LRTGSDPKWKAQSTKDDVVAAAPLLAEGSASKSTDDAEHLLKPSNPPESKTKNSADTEKSEVAEDKKEGEQTFW